MMEPIWNERVTFPLRCFSARQKFWRCRRRDDSGVVDGCFDRGCFIQHRGAAQELLKGNEPALTAAMCGRHLNSSDVQRHLVRGELRVTGYAAFQSVGFGEMLRCLELLGVITHRDALIVNTGVSHNLISTLRPAIDAFVVRTRSEPEPIDRATASAPSRTGVASRGGPAAAPVHAVARDNPAELPDGGRDLRRPAPD